MCFNHQVQSKKKESSHSLMDRVSTSWGAAPGQLLCVTCDRKFCYWLAGLVGGDQGQVCFPCPCPTSARKREQQSHRAVSQAFKKEKKSFLWGRERKSWGGGPLIREMWATELLSIRIQDWKLFGPLQLLCGDDCYCDIVLCYFLWIKSLWYFSYIVSYRDGCGPALQTLCLGKWIPSFT